MQISHQISKILSEYFDLQVEVVSQRPIGGGSINSALQVETNKGVFFVKHNSKHLYPAMFEKEALGLKKLRDSNAIAVPDVLTFDEEGNNAFLFLNFIESRNKTDDFWDDFAQKLAALHKNTNKEFGLAHHNYIGSLRQFNEWDETWAGFFTEQRLEPQLKMARDAGMLGRGTTNAFQRFYKRIEEIFPNEPSSLLHGDLWSGNFMVGEDGKVVLIDPAIYYGHREMDLAMSQLFGGFSQQFYKSYNKYFPLEKGWQQRMDYCNLYPLLVHVNLFGGGYAGSVKSIIGKF
jgi:fructosamine-3-kinase